MEKMTHSSGRTISATAVTAAFCGALLMMLGVSFGGAKQTVADGMADGGTEPPRCTTQQLAANEPGDTEIGTAQDDVTEIEEIEEDVILPQEFSTEKVTEETEITEVETDAQQTQETVAAETTPVTEETEMPVTEDEDYIYEKVDLPLNEEQQKIAISIAKEYGLQTELLYGIMYTESRYTVNIKSADGGNYGIMQINTCNFDMLKKALGVYDFLDFESNVRSGAYILSLLSPRYQDAAKLLMCYNRGETAAWAQWNKGNTYDAYCKSVLTERDRLLAIKNS